MINLGASLVHRPRVRARFPRAFALLGLTPVLQGAPAHFHYGNHGGRTTLPRQRLVNPPQTMIAPLGRSDSQTQFRMDATLHSIFGRTRLQLEHEVKPFGVPLDGSNTFPGLAVDTGSDGEHAFTRLVAGLTPGTLYHWRVRAKYDLTKSPYQRHGPWMHMPTNGWNEADLRTAPAPVSVASTPPSRFDLLASGANPGRGRCGVRLVLPQPASVDAEVLDVRGRRIAVIAEHVAYGAGSYALTWEGRDGRGAQTPPGIYFIRARTVGVTRIRKVVLTR